jgi:hypothetical protein
MTAVMGTLPPDPGHGHDSVPTFGSSFGTHDYGRANGNGEVDTSLEQEDFEPIGKCYKTHGPCFDECLAIDYPGDEKNCFQKTHSAPYDLKTFGSILCFRDDISIYRRHRSCHMKLIQQRMGGTIDQAKEMLLNSYRRCSQKCSKISPDYIQAFRDLNICRKTDHVKFYNCMTKTFGYDIDSTTNCRQQFYPQSKSPVDICRQTNVQTSFGDYISCLENAIQKNEGPGIDGPLTLFAATQRCSQK